jgi:hypothetical protein
VHLRKLESNRFIFEVDFERSADELMKDPESACAVNPAY